MHFRHLALLAFALPAFSLTNHVLSTECYSSAGSLKDQGSYTYQSPGYCQAQCRKNGFTVAGLSDGTHCWCGNEKPPQSARVDGQRCNMMCSGWPEAHCGGKHVWTVFSTGDPELAPSSDNSTVSASTAPGGIVVAPTTATTSVQAATVTAPSKATTTRASSASASVSASAAASASKVSASASASASPTPLNAASAVRAGSSVFGAVIAGLGLLL